MCDKSPSGVRREGCRGLDTPHEVQIMVPCTSPRHRQGPYDLKLEANKMDDSSPTTRPFRRRNTGINRPRTIFPLFTVYCRSSLGANENAVPEVTVNSMILYNDFSRGPTVDDVNPASLDIKQYILPYFR